MVDMKVIKGGKANKNVNKRYMGSYKYSKEDIKELLSNLGIIYKESMKKQELFNLLYDTYNNGNIDNLIYILSNNAIDMLNRILKGNCKIIVNSDTSFYTMSSILELISILVIEAEITDNINEMIFDTKLNNNINEGINRLFSDEYKTKINKINKLSQIMKAIVYVYGVIEYDEMIQMLNRLFKNKVDEHDIYMLIMHSIDFNQFIDFIDIDDVEYFCQSGVYNIEEILEEREKRNITYKKYSLKELEMIIDGQFKPSQAELDLYEFLCDIHAEGQNLFYYISNQISTNTDSNDITDYMHIKELQLNRKDLEKYLDLYNNAYNHIAQYALYGYSPIELMEKMKNKGVYKLY